MSIFTSLTDHLPTLHPRHTEMTQLNPEQIDTLRSDIRDGVQKVETTSILHRRKLTKALADYALLFAKIKDIPPFEVLSILNTVIPTRGKYISPLSHLAVKRAAIDAARTAFKNSPQEAEACIQAISETSPDLSFPAALENTRSAEDSTESIIHITEAKIYRTNQLNQETGKQDACEPIAADLLDELEKKEIGNPTSE